MSFRTFVRALLFVCLAPSLSLPAAAPPIALEPVLAAQAGEHADTRIQVGHATLVMERGVASPLMIGDRTVGYFYQGAGSFEFTSDLPLERAVMQHNLAKDARVKPLETPTGLLVKDRIKQVAIIMAGQPLPDLRTAPTGQESPLAFEFGMHMKRFFGHRPSPLAQQLAHQALQGENKPMVTLLIQGERNDWYYQFDGVQTLLERLMLRGISGSVQISRLPIGWNAKDPLGPDFTLTHVDLSLSLDKTLQGELVAKETLVPAQAGMKAVRLELHSFDQFQDATPAAWKVNSVQDGLGRNLAFDHRAGQILVALEGATQAGVPLTLTFRIANPVLNQFSLSDYWELGVSPWFPMPGLSGQYYTVKASMRVPDPYVPFMGGTTLRRSRAGGFSELAVVIDRPVQFFTMHAGNYNVTELKEGDLLVRVCSSKVLGGQEERLARITLQMIKGYETFLGPFPFREFNVIQRPVWGHGQAPPGLMMITSEAFNALGDNLSKMFSKGINQRVAHEIAHQYWGHVVKMPTQEEQWITESFAEYCSALMMLKTKGQGQGAFDSLVEQWERGAKVSAHISSIFTANQIGDLAMPSQAAQARTHLIYDKGALVLYRLHKDIGDAAFFRFLMTLQSGLNFKFATTLDLIDALKAVTKKDMTPFFDSFFWGTAMPLR
jgi:hypothetical protein